jgi:hypothetical protein
MATATAVLAVGAIPVIVDVDESITIDPDAIDDTAGFEPLRVGVPERHRRPDRAP